MTGCCTRGPSSVHKLPRVSMVVASSLSFFRLPVYQKGKLHQQHGSTQAFPPFSVLQFQVCWGLKFDLSEFWNPTVTSLGPFFFIWQPASKPSTWGISWKVDARETRVSRGCFARPNRWACSQSIYPKNGHTRFCCAADSELFWIQRFQWRSWATLSCLQFLYLFLPFFRIGDT